MAEQQHLKILEKCGECLHFEKSHCQLGYVVKAKSKVCSQESARSRQRP